MWFFVEETFMIRNSDIRLNPSDVVLHTTHRESPAARSSLTQGQVHGRGPRCTRSRWVRQRSADPVCYCLWFGSPGIELVTRGRIRSS